MSRAGVLFGLPLLAACVVAGCGDTRDRDLDATIPLADAASGPPRDGGPTVPFDGGGGPRVDSPPVILSLRLSGTTLTPDGPITISVVLTDPNGIDDLIGGELFDASSGAAYGSFVTSAGEGSYSQIVTWDQANRMTPIDAPATGGQRTLRARFFDSTGLTAERDIEVLLRCARDVSVCDGRCDGRTRCGDRCVNLENDEAQCGACGFSCSAFGTREYTARCEAGRCQWGAFSTARQDCETICAAQSGECLGGSPDARYCFSGCSSTRSRRVACGTVPATTMTEGTRTYDYNSIQCTCAVSASGVVCDSGPENTDARCSDGCSNDGDIYVDCDDFDCDGTAGCR